jgi:hypothetical protein
MAKRIFLLLVLLLFCQESVWAQRAREDDRAARKQWEEDQRADEYANSLRRRDWLKDRLILELGMGSKFPVMGENWFGFGAGVEYITRWHASAFLTAGFIPSHADPAFPDSDDGFNNQAHYELEGGIGWRFGLAYYMFPKSPIHLGAQVSYGTVYYDHVTEPGSDGKTRELLKCMGYEFDITLSYLSDQWYFLQAIIGMYYIGNGIKDIDKPTNQLDDNEKEGNSGFGLQNPSWKINSEGGIETKVTKKTGSQKDYAIPPYGVVFGIGIGFAFDELFPDDTEVRRRERESKTKQSDMRRPAASSRSTSSSASRRPTTRAVEAEETVEEEE